MEHRERIARVYSRAGALCSGIGGRGTSAIHRLLVMRLVEEKSLMVRLRSADKLRDIVLDESGVDAILHKLGMLQKTLQKIDVRRDALDSEFAERSIRLGNCVSEIGRTGMRNAFLDHRAEVPTRGIPDAAQRTA